MKSEGEEEKRERVCVVGEEEIKTKEENREVVSKLRTASRGRSSEERIKALGVGGRRKQKK